MHDLNYFRDHLDEFAEMAKKRNTTLDLDGFRALDKERRELIRENEERKAQRNKASDEIARLKKAKESADALLAEMKQLSEKIKLVDERISELDTKQRDFLLTIPNIPHKSVPTAKVPRETRKCGDGARLRNLIFNRSRTGKWAKRAGILDLEAAAESPARVSPCIRAGERGWSGRWRISFWMCIPANTATRRSFHHSW